MRRSYRAHHPDMGKAIAGARGRGGPIPVDPTRQQPISSPVQIPNPIQGVLDGLRGSVTAGLTAILANGQVAVGVVLVVVGLLLAAGQLRGAARGVGIGR